jgi:hypothetical protein
MIVSVDALDRTGVTAVTHQLVAFGSNARNLDAGIGTGFLSLGLRRPHGLLCFGANTLGLGSRLFDFTVGRCGFAACVLEFHLGLLDVAACFLDGGLDARDLSAGVRTDFLGIGSSFFGVPMGRGNFAAGVF